MTKSNSLLDQFTLKLSASVLPGNENYNGEIFHYTSLKNINSILLENEDIVLYASRFDCLNDTTEGKIVGQRYKSVCDKLKTENLISEEMYELFYNVPPSRNETFIILKDGKVKPVRCEYGTYITSFSTGHDLLPMWNYYSKGNMYEGFNIGLSAKDVVSSLKSKFPDGSVSVSVCPVIYRKELQEEMIRKFLLELNDKYEKGYETSVRAIVSMKQTSWQMIFKNECFAHEKEVRIIVKVADKFKDAFKVNYRTATGYIVPYIKLHIEKSAATSITLGPIQSDADQTEVQTKVLHEMLSAHGFSIVERCSSIPIRY